MIDLGHGVGLIFSSNQSVVQETDVHVRRGPSLQFPQVDNDYQRIYCTVKYHPGKELNVTCVNYNTHQRTTNNLAQPNSDPYNGRSVDFFRMVDNQNPDAELYTGAWYKSSTLFGNMRTVPKEVLRMVGHKVDGNLRHIEIRLQEYRKPDHNPSNVKSIKTGENLTLEEIAASRYEMRKKDPGVWSVVYSLVPEGVPSGSRPVTYERKGYRLPAVMEKGESSR